MRGESQGENAADPMTVSVLQRTPPGQSGGPVLMFSHTTTLKGGV